MKNHPFSLSLPAARPWRALAGALMLALAGCGAVKPAAVVVAPVPPSHSVDEADRKLAQVLHERAQTEAAFAASEQVCYAKFFVNNCLDVAHEKRRVALSALRAIEIEAEHFKRQAKVDERDRAMAAAEKEFQAQQARAAEAPPVQRAAPESAPKPAPTPNRREAEQAAKLRQLEAQDKADAPKRAANVAAFEQRQRDAEQRQREIANKKKAAVSEGEAP